VDCVFSVFTPSKGMTSVSVVRKEVDTARDQRLTAHSESLRSPDNGVSSGGFLDKDTKRHISKGKSTSARGSDKSNKRRTSDASEHSSSGAFESTGAESSVTTRKVMQPLQLQNASKKQSGPDLQPSSSIQQSRGKGKEDLDEILRKRLAELESQLSMIGSEHSAAGVEEFTEDVAEVADRGDGGRIVSANSRAERKRKAHNKRGTGADKCAKKRHRTISDEQARIIAANIDDGSMTNGADAKFDKYISTILTNETYPSEELSAIFSEEITSVIESEIQEHSQQNDEFGKLFSSSSAEQLVDTETIMLNVLSQNLPDAYASDEEQAHIENTGVWPGMADDDAAILQLQLQSLQPEPESNENGANLECSRVAEDKHLGGLSVDTQWDSQFVESFAVKSTHLNTVRDWRSKKMLDLLISGRLKEIPVAASSKVQHEGTDKLVASSLQNILSNISWLWSVAVGDDMLESVQDVVCNAANNLDSLMIDFVEDSGCVDIPVSMHLSSDQTADVTDAEVAAVKEEINKLDDWSDEESLLIEGLVRSLDGARESVLNQKEATDLAENADADVPADLYSPTRPTEMDLASSGGDVGVQRPKEASQTETVNELQFQQGLVVSETFNDLVESSTPTRRTVRIHKKENATEKSSKKENITAKSSSDGIKGTAVHTSGDRSSRLKIRGLSEKDLGNVDSQLSGVGFANSKPVMSTRLESNLSVSEEILMNQSVDLTNIMEVEVATNGLPSERTISIQARDTKSADKHITDVTEELDLSIENLYGMNSAAASVVSRTVKSSRKHSSGRDEVPGKAQSCHTDAKKDSHSRKHKERPVDVTGKKDKKKTEDIGRLTDRQLKLNVRSELNHVQKIIKSLLYDNYGITTTNTSKLSRDVSLRGVDKHFQVLSVTSADSNLAATTGEDEANDIVKAASLTPLLNDILNELNIPLTTIHLMLPENPPSVVLTDRLVAEKTSTELNHSKKSRVEPPSSPPSMRRNTAKQTSALRRNRSSEEGGVSVVPHRRPEAPVTEGEKRLMKADKLMQTFRRSQIAKRQSQRVSPQPAASFIRQVRTVTRKEGVNLAITDNVESHTAVSSSDVKEPDFSTVITDGSMLASVELPEVLPSFLPPPESEIVMPVVSQTLSSEPPHSAEPVQVSSPADVENSTGNLPVPSLEVTVSSSVDRKITRAVVSAGKEQRVYVLNSDKPLCHEVQVCINLNVWVFLATLIGVLVCCGHIYRGQWTFLIDLTSVCLSVICIVYSF